MYTYFSNQQVVVIFHKPFIGLGYKVLPTYATKVSVVPEVELHIILLNVLLVRLKS